MAGKEILILGSSFGGYHAATRLAKILGGRHSITVVSKDDHFTFTPSLPWVAMGWRDATRIQIPLPGLFARKGVGFSQDTIVRLEPENRIAKGIKGDYRYDYLLIATGSELDFGVAPGMGPEGGNSYSIFSVDQALQAGSALEAAIAKGSGSLVFGNAQGASCLGPAYEMAMLTDTLLRRKGIRSRFNISFFTNEPFLGHFGVGGFGGLTRALEDEFADREISWKSNVSLSKVTEETVDLSDGPQFGNDFSLIIPPFFGSHAYMGVEGLANPRGFVLANNDLSNPKYPEIYSAGVALAIPPLKTPVPTGVPKTGQMTERMARVAADNIVADITGALKKDGKNFSVTCVADAGDKAFFIAADPLLAPRNRLVYKKGRIFHLMKLVFERYYVQSIRMGLPVLDVGV
ncbi:MAG: FAD-dependent oxidoreductase [Nitrospinae bacterium]|nr:FAD-dependent oxidoreductase [Nitrospinota bacterium]